MKEKPNKINEEVFESLHKMLSSEDPEDGNTALMLMENMDFRSGRMFFAILYRDFKNAANRWEEHAPNLLKNLNNLGIDSSFTWKSIWNNLKGNSSMEEKVFFIKKFNPIIGKLLCEWGFKDTLEDMEIIIKLKTKNES